MVLKEYALLTCTQTKHGFYPLGWLHERPKGLPLIGLKCMLPTNQKVTIILNVPHTWPNVMLD